MRGGVNLKCNKAVPERTGLASTHTRDVYYGYDVRGLQTSARFDSASGEGVTNSYDAQGRRAQQALGAAVTGYGYDGISRLASLSHDLAGTAQDVSLGFAYNPASQLVSRSRSNDAYAWRGYANYSTNLDRAYAVNGLNQYTSAGGLAFGYDANGNLTGDSRSTYLYDVENRLVSVSGATAATLRYDPLGRLYEVAGGGGATRFLYDGDALVAEHDAASSALLRRYVHGSDATGDDPLFWFEGPGLADRRGLHADHQGSVMAVSTAAGGVPNSYDEWGIPGAANQGRFQYTGQAWLPEIGMYHYKARIYSPTLGRFLQTDPVGYDDQINLYAYVANDPINGTDPTGMESAGVAYSSIRSLTEASEEQNKTNEQPAFRQIFGAFRDFFENYRQMRDENLIGNDKKHHCQANCEASARGSIGEAMSRSMSDFREDSDDFRKGENPDDRKADEAGITVTRTLFT